MASSVSTRSGNVTFLLGLFGTTLGLHHFYTGNYRAGALMLLADTALSLFGVFLGPVYLAIGIPLVLWWLSDLARISSDQFKDGSQRQVSFLNGNGDWPKLSLTAMGIVLLTAASTLLASMYLVPALLGGACLVAGIVCLAKVLSRLGGNSGYSSTVIVPAAPMVYSNGSTVSLMPTLGYDPSPVYVPAAQPLSPVSVSRPHHVATHGHTFGHGGHHGGGHLEVTKSAPIHHGGAIQGGALRRH